MALRAFDAHRDRPRVFALRVGGAADEFAEAPVLFHQAIAASGALLVERLIRLMRDARPLHQAPRGLAIRIAGASQKRAKAPALDSHFLAAIIAIVSLVLVAGVGLNGRKVFDEVALGIARAAQEEAVAADAFEQFALPAFLAFFSRRNAGFVREHFVIGLVEVEDELFPELFHGLAPRQLALFDFVEFFLHPRGELEIENVFKAFYQELAYALAKHGRRKTALILRDVLSFDQRRNNGGVSRGAADAVLFELFHQRRVVVARRRLGEVLVGTNLVQPQQLTLGDLGQIPALAFLVLLVFFAIRG